MPTDLVFGVVGMDPVAPCHVSFMESLREQLKSAYKLVQTELQKSARWQKVGYDTGLKYGRFEVDEQVLRLHKPLSNIKLASNWDGFLKASVQQPVLSDGAMRFHYGCEDLHENKKHWIGSFPSFAPKTARMHKHDSFAFCVGVGGLQIGATCSRKFWD